MKLFFNYSLLFLCVLSVQQYAAITVQPYRIVCFANGIPFLKKQIGKTLFHRPHCKISWVGQLFAWRVPRVLDLNIYNTRADQCKVKVLLAHLQEKESLEMMAKSGFVITSFGCPAKKLTMYGSKVEVNFLANNILLNGKKFPLPIAIKPVRDNIILNGVEYKGDMILAVADKKLLVVNKLPLEDYVYSVLRSESWPGWPLEVNKAFAIASRSYAMAKVLENTRKKRQKEYHFKNTNIHQTYRGHHFDEKLLQAVHETEGVILAHNKKPILAMFDCCCGGIIPAKLSGVDFLKAPYLKREKVCDFCKSSKIYQWDLDIALHDFAKILSGAGYKIPSIKAIKVCHDDAGAVQKVIINGHKPDHLIDISGKQFYSLIKKVKSYCYSIVKKNKNFLTIQGKGYGHHLGLCQWGARRMVDHGYTYRDILKFYYPETNFMKIALNTE